MRSPEIRESVKSFPGMPAEEHAAPIGPFHKRAGIGAAVMLQLFAQRRAVIEAEKFDFREFRLHVLPEAMRTKRQLMLPKHRVQKGFRTRPEKNAVVDIERAIIGGEKPPRLYFQEALAAYLVLLEGGCHVPDGPRLASKVRVIREADEVERGMCSRRLLIKGLVSA